LQLSGWGCLNLALAIGLIIATTVYLWPQWRHNPDLSHGWFTPLIFVLLIHEARTRGSQRFLSPSAGTSSTIAALLLAGLVLLAAGGLYMAALEWTHALVATMLTGALCLLLAATWIAFSLRSVRLVPFNWQAGVALLVWLLSSPLPPGTYGTLTQGLQAIVTTVVVGTLHLLGIAAVQHGNVIQLANVSVGIEEACSGVRSLISCVYAGLFFSATLARTRRARALIIVLAGPLAWVMNLLRSITLTLLAHRGVDISGAWHDLTGFAILGVTAALLAGLAILLSKSASPVLINPRQPPFATPLQDSVRSDRPTQLLVSGGLLLAVGITVLFILNTRPASNLGRAAPDLAALLPASFDGWQINSDKDLAQFSAQLQTDRLAATSYNRQTSRGPLEITVYLAYWPAGSAPVSAVAAHTPDACWPGAGWTALPVTNSRIPVALGHRQLDDAEYRQFVQREFLQHVWYWHLYNGRVIHPEGIRSPRQLLTLAFKYGFHREGEQLFVRVSSNQPWEIISAEPLLQEIFARLVPFGL
jgi:exosortase